MLGAPFPGRPMTAPEYRTTDTYLAAFLVSQGIDLAGFRRIGPKKVEFRFPAGRRLHGLLRVYWSGEPVLFTLARLFAAHRQLKSKSPLEPSELRPSF
jgi:hypothetical protein